MRGNELRREQTNPVATRPALILSGSLARSLALYAVERLGAGAESRASDFFTAGHAVSVLVFAESVSCRARQLKLCLLRYAICFEHFLLLDRIDSRDASHSRLVEFDGPRRRRCLRQRRFKVLDKVAEGS